MIILSGREYENKSPAAVFIGSVADAVGIAAVVAGAGFYGWILLERSNGGQVALQRTTGLSTTAPNQPKVAVLYFDNLSGDEELEWLRSGLTDMLVTDLSQSPDLRVLPTDRLYQILADGDDRG